MFYLSLINKDKLKLIIFSNKKSITLQPIVLSPYIENIENFN